MKVLLLYPGIRKSFSVIPPLGLGYLASVLLERGHEVRILDCTKESIEPESIVEYLKGYVPELVGMTLYSKDLSRSRRYFLSLRKAFPEIRTILGGPHFSALPEQTLLFMNVDYGIAGEGERGFPAIADSLDNGKSMRLDEIAGLVWKEGLHVQSNPRSVVENLDEIPFPAWDLLKPHRYPKAPSSGFAKCFPTAPILISRGCKYRCLYCSAKTIYGKGYRVRRPWNVLEEVQLLTRTYGIREIQVLDDNLFQDMPFVRELSTHFISNGLSLPWCLPNGARVEDLTHSDIRLLKRAGLYKMGVGIESGSQRILDRMGKRSNLNVIREKIEMLETEGIETIGYFILGFPGETKQDVEATIRLSTRLPLVRAEYSYFTPLPGSTIWKELMKNGEVSLEEAEADSFYLLNRSYAQALTKKDLQRLKAKAYLSFYGKARNFLRLCRDIRSVEHFTNIVRRVRSLIAEAFTSFLTFPR